MQENWDVHIESKVSIWNIPFRELWKYRDLLKMFIVRDIITIYKQTILGPIWFFLQPMLTTIIYVVVFGRIAGIETGSLPRVLFYLCGIVVWNFFAEGFNTTSKTLLENANILGKIYFPRLIVPISKICSGLIKFGIQFSLFIAVLVYYIIFHDVTVTFDLTWLLLPILILMMSMLGLAFGLIFTSLTTKYRDLNFLIQFGVQLLMYASPVIYPVSTIPETYKKWILLNPMTPILEGFKKIILGEGMLDFNYLVYSFSFAFIALMIGILAFNRAEKNFIDTI